MIKRLASAVLLAALSVVGTMNFDVPEDDGDDDAFVEYSEYGGASDSEQRGGVIALARQTCGEPIDHAWVVRQSRGASAAAAVQQVSDDTALVNLAGDAVPPGFVYLLLGRALHWCRDAGALKVLVESDALSLSDIQGTAQACGFQFSRKRRLDDGDVIEFYTDLYWRPDARNVHG
jgi:hypothetical protein